MSIITKEPDAKVLVFSQWNDVLVLMGRALQENQIQFVSVLGGKKKFNQVTFSYSLSLSPLSNCYDNCTLPDFDHLNGFSFIHIQNIETFRMRADVKVLLLPVKSGANGLNLIEATHVILIEPSINPSIEAQAIGSFSLCSVILNLETTEV